MRPRVDRAERAEREALRREQRRADVEAQVVRLPGQRVIGEARIVREILDDHRVLAPDRVRARREFAREFVRTETDAPFDDLPVGIADRHQGDLGVENRGDDAADRVERLVARAGEEIVASERG